MTIYFNKWLIVSIVIIAANSCFSGVEEGKGLTGYLEGLGLLIAKEIEDLKGYTDESSTANTFVRHKDFDRVDLTSDNCRKQKSKTKSRKRSIEKKLKALNYNSTNEGKTKSLARSKIQKCFTNEFNNGKSALKNLIKRDLEKDINLNDTSSNLNGIKVNKLNGNEIDEKKGNKRFSIVNADNNTICVQNYNPRLFRGVKDKSDKVITNIPVKIIQETELNNKNSLAEVNSRIMTNGIDARINNILPHPRMYLQKLSCEDCDVDGECNYKRVLGMSRVVDSIFDNLGTNIRKDLGINKKSFSYDEYPVTNDEDTMDKIIDEMVASIKQSLKGNVPLKSCAPLPRELNSFLIWLLHGSEGGHNCPPTVQDTKTRYTYIFHEDHHKPHICGSAFHAERGHVQPSKVKPPDALMTQSPSNEIGNSSDNDLMNQFSQNRYAYIPHKNLKQQIQNNTINHGYLSSLFDGNILFPETQFVDQNIESSFGDRINELCAVPKPINLSYPKSQFSQKERDTQEPLYIYGNHNYYEINDHDKVVMKRDLHKEINKMKCNEMNRSVSNLNSFGADHDKKQSNSQKNEVVLSPHNITIHNTTQLQIHNCTKENKNKSLNINGSSNKARRKEIWNTSVNVEKNTLVAAPIKHKPKRDCAIGAARDKFANLSFVKEDTKRSIGDAFGSKFSLNNSKLNTSMNSHANNTVKQCIMPSQSNGYKINQKRNFLHRQDIKICGKDKKKMGVLSQKHGQLPGKNKSEESNQNNIDIKHQKCYYSNFSYPNRRGSCSQRIPEVNTLKYIIHGAHLLANVSKTNKNPL